MALKKNSRLTPPASSPGSPRVEDLPPTRRTRATRSPRPHRHRAALEKASTAELWGSLMSERGTVSLEALGELRDLLQARYFDVAQSQVQRRIAD